MLRASDRPEEVVVYDPRRRGQAVDRGELGGSAASQASAHARKPTERLLLQKLGVLVVVVLLAARQILPDRRRAARVRAARYELGARSLHDALKIQKWRFFCLAFFLIFLLK